MRLARWVSLGVSLGIAASSAAARATSVDAPPRGGAVAIDHEALAAFVADSDGAALHRVDLLSGEVRTTKLACAPEQALVLDAVRVAVTLRACNRVAVVSYEGDADGEVVAEVEVAADPFGLALASPGLLIVTSAWGHALTGVAFDGAALDPGPHASRGLSTRFTLNLPKEPRGVVVTNDGARAFVSHVAGDRVTVVDLAGDGAAEGPRARELDVLGGKYRNLVDADAGGATQHTKSALAFAVAMNEEGTRVFVPHVALEVGDDAEHVVSSGYGSVRVQEDTTVASVAVVSVADGTALGAPREASKPPARRAPRARIPTSPRLGFAVAPRGSAARQARAAAVLGDRLYVASLGTDELVELDARSLDPALSVKRSFAVGAGPTGVDVDPATRIAVVWSQFAHELAIISLDSGGLERVAVGSEGLPPDVAAGRRLFYTETDPRTSRDGRACASCHPDGREDGLVWRLGGAPRQTPMLVGRLDRGPFGWMGKHDTLEGNMQETMTRLGGAGLTGAALTSLAAYLRRGLVAPTRAASSDPRVARGKELFASNETGCTNCHREGREWSDRDLHDVGSKAPGDDSTKFRTPPLVFLEGTAPYFHDGRYATLEQLLDDDLDRMGNTTQLTRDDRDALAAFLRTL